MQPSVEKAPTSKKQLWAGRVISALPVLMLGAILMTAYLGDATASNVRVGDPSCLATVILGILVWGGFFLRDARLRALLSFRS